MNEVEDPVVVVSDPRAAGLEIERPVFDADVRVIHRYCETATAVAELADTVEGTVVAVLSNARTPVTDAAFVTLPALRVVAQIGTGVDNIDVDTAREHGVTVTNVPDYSVDEVSTHALSLLLTAARSVTTYAEAVAAGGWDWHDGRPIHRLAERTVGVIGYGRIGRRTASKLAPLFETVLATDPYVDAERLRADGVEPVEMDALLERSHAITVHVPLTDETRGLLDAAAFERMGAAHDEGVVFVNTARGAVVDEDALVTALQDGRVRTAGLDVLAEEPPTDRRLVDRPDTVVTPHAGWYSEESTREVRRRAAENARRVLDGDEPADPVDAEWL